VPERDIRGNDLKPFALHIPSDGDENRLCKNSWMSGSNAISERFQVAARSLE
jgi:hypothetical protein